MVLVMSIWGKLGGAAAGFLLGGGPIGALAGFVAGHVLFDRGAGAEAGQEIFGVLIGWNGVMVVFCELPLTRVMQRFPPRSVMCLGYLLFGGGFEAVDDRRGTPE